MICASCGTENEAGRKFCGERGTSLTEAATLAARPVTAPSTG